MLQTKRKQPRVTPPTVHFISACKSSTVTVLYCIFTVHIHIFMCRNDVCLYIVDIKVKLRF